MARLKLWSDDFVKARDVAFRVVAISSESVEIETMRGGVLEINTDETHPDEQVASDARDPNAGGIPPWTWPEWLTCAAIAKDAGGAWYGYDEEMPEIITGESVWASNGDLFQLSGVVDTSRFPDVPWNESLRINPNRKAS